MTKRKPEGLQPVINKHNKQEQICHNMSFAEVCHICKGKSIYVNIIKIKCLQDGRSLELKGKVVAEEVAKARYWERDKFVKILRLSVQDAARNATSYLWTA